MARFSELEGFTKRVLGPGFQNYRKAVLDLDIAENRGFLLAAPETPFSPLRVRMARLHFSTYRTPPLPASMVYR